MPNFDPGDAVNDDLWEEKECTRVTPVSDNIPRQRFDISLSISLYLCISLLVNYSSSFTLMSRECNP